MVLLEQAEYFKMVLATKTSNRILNSGGGEGKSINQLDYLGPFYCQTTNKQPQNLGSDPKICNMTFRLWLMTWPLCGEGNLVLKAYGGAEASQLYLLAPVL